jgi:hypothetical protein
MLKLGIQLLEIIKGTSSRQGALSKIFNCVFSYVKVKVKVKVTLRLTISQSVCLGVEPKYGTFDQRFLFLFFFFIFFLKFQSCHFWGALSDERSGLSYVFW